MNELVNSLFLAKLDNAQFEIVKALDKLKGDNFFNGSVDPDLNKLDLETLGNYYDCLMWLRSTIEGK